MAEFTANAVQTVNTNQNILFSDKAVSSGNCSIIHREDSGLITLRGVTRQCRARFKVFFSGNIAIPTGGAVGAISLAIATNGEPVNTTTMIATPTTTGAYNNVAGAIYLDVPAGCCIQVSVKNTSSQAIVVQNSNVIVERIA